MAQNQNKYNISIAVRHLAEMSHRHGGLATPIYGGIESLEGIKAHQKFVQSLNDNSNLYDLILSELSLTDDIIWQDFNFQLKGRLDCLTMQANHLTLYEIKSFQNDPLFLPKDGDPTHWAQLIIYAYLLKQMDPKLLALKIQDPDTLKCFEQYLYQDQIELILVYAAVDKEQMVFKKKYLNWQEIKEQVYISLEKYTKYILYFLEWQNVRDHSIKNSTFPFDKFRVGQVEMMRQVLGTIRDKDSLICQAPTGIGKTMATLYPAVKALSAKYVHKIFYCTAMISTREIAENSLDILRQNGFMLKSLRFQSKEKICLQPDLFCDQTLCPYAIDYYERLPDALHELMPEQKITPEMIQAVALKHQVCPHELSLDYADFCDVLIGDYNHIFDPQAKFSRFLDNPDNPMALLIDEAHNLPSRARNMFSADISQETFLAIRNIIKTPSLQISNQYQSLLQYLEEMIILFTKFSDILKLKQKPKTNPFFSNNHSKWLIEDNFIGLREKPDLLLKRLNILHQDIREFLDQQKLFEGRQEILNHWFDLNYFLKIANQYFDQAYITAFQMDQKNNLHCFLLALDAGKYITENYQGKHAAVFFSATLSPMNYYHQLLNSNSENFPSELLSLASPFPAQNRLLAALTEYSVKFKDRDNTFLPISKFIYAAVQKKVGNYLVFVPSYQYLFKIKDIFTHQLYDAKLKLSFQQRNMSQTQKNQFLKKFDNFGNDTLLSFVILGNHFNEGIDLVGEKLSGVFVIGTGLPRISPERELMTQYYAEKYEGGKAYGYQYPGFNHIQQAVGRLIRDENDIGFAVLIDQRYESSEWQIIYPDDWNVQNFDQQSALLDEIDVFWSDHQ